jgi:hypothetical protein
MAGDLHAKRPAHACCRRNTAKTFRPKKNTPVGAKVRALVLRSTPEKQSTVVFSACRPTRRRDRACLRSTSQPRASQQACRPPPPPRAHCTRPYPRTQGLQLKRHIDATLGQGNLIEAVRLPPGEDLNEWLAVNTVDFYNAISVLYSTLAEFCTDANCEVMSAGSKVRAWPQGAAWCARARVCVGRSQMRAAPTCDRVHCCSS